jgi:D-alanyl-lipoteichoic acid acyltransferase DltB (MBOAT superfamily)
MIGLASLCHLELPENFNRPFSASNFIEFWTRWHMTLSNWLKAYVFTPLLKVLMNKFPEPRVEPFLGVIGFFVTFFLIGLWHGQTSVFLFFGFLVGGGVAANKLFQIFFATVLTRKGYKTLSQNQFYVALSRGLTFAYFALVLIWFWSRWPQIARLAAALTITQEIVVWLALWLGATIILAAWEGLRMNAMRLRWN